MSIKVKVKAATSYRKKAEEASRRATEIVMGELSAAFQASFDAEVWSWPRATYRSNGSVVTEPRNIIDTKGLYNSHSWTMTGPYQATFRWSKNYATGVHDGAYLVPFGKFNKADFIGPQRRIYLPPRPWTSAVMGTQPTEGITPFPLGSRLRDVWKVQIKVK